MFVAAETLMQEQGSTGNRTTTIGLKIRIVARHQLHRHEVFSLGTNGRLYFVLECVTKLRLSCSYGFQLIGFLE